MRKNRLIVIITSLFLIAGVSVFTFSPTFGQGKKEELQKQRDDLNAKIALTKKLINESESNQKVTSGQLSI